MTALHDLTSGNRLFFSCVSDEFEKTNAPFPGFRSTIRHYLTRADCEVKVQEDFRQEGSVDTVEKLSGYIRRCAAVIHLIGEKTGAIATEGAVADYLSVEPDFLKGHPQLRESLGDLSGLSYTQWEALIALHHGIPLFVYATPASLTSQVTHLTRLRLAGRYHSERLIADPADLLGLLIGDLREIIPSVVRKLKLKPTDIISVKNQGSDVTLNILMRWGFFQRPAVVLLKTSHNGELVLSSFARANEAGTMEAKELGKIIPHRIWIRLSGLSVIEWVAGSSQMVAELMKHGALDSDETETLKNGQSLLGLVVDRLPDLSPRTMGQIQTWLDAIQTALPDCAPLLIVMHDLQDDSVAARSLRGVVECLRTTPDFHSDPTAIIADRAVRDSAAHGIGTLLALAGRGKIPGHAEQTAMEKLQPWHSEEPAALPSPLCAGGVAQQLEAMDAPQAKDLAKTLCSWLIHHQPGLAAPVFQAFARSSMPGLPVLAAHAAMDHPELLDAWMAGLPNESRTQVMDAVSAQHPIVSGQAATAWMRRLLRGQLADADACVRWIHGHCRALAPVADAVLPGVNRNALLALLQSNAAAGHFHWLRELAPCLEIPLDKVDAGARQREEFWTLVQALPATPGHLHGLFSLSAAELAVLGCPPSGPAANTLSAAIAAHAMTLRQQSAS